MEANTLLLMDTRADKLKPQTSSIYMLLNPSQEEEEPEDDGIMMPSSPETCPPEKILDQDAKHFVNFLAILDLQGKNNS